jgi:hypothetical protein
MVIEEGPLADWLLRNLGGLVDEMVCCDPHRNALIAKEGEKSDAIDWRKLAELYRGGYVKQVHHPQELSRSLLKQHVQLYHERVAHRVRAPPSRRRRRGTTCLPTNTKGGWMTNARPGSRVAIRLEAWRR